MRPTRLLETLVEVAAMGFKDIFATHQATDQGIHGITEQG
jgi:hypothetical protein